MGITFSILDQGRVAAVEGNLAGDAVHIAPEDFATIGWALKPQGFCKDELCFPIPSQSTVVTSAGVDLAGFASLIGRPLAIDIEARAAYLGTAAADRSAQLATLQAPEFALPDLDGTMHTLSEQRGKKVLLAAYGSW